MPIASRRTVLLCGLTAGAFALPTLTACTPDYEQSSPPPAPDPDRTLAEEMLEAELAVLTLIDSVTVGRPRRAQSLAGTRAVHEAHVRLLEQSVSGMTPSSSPSPTTTGEPFAGGDRAAYRTLARAEDRLGAELREAALRAESGSFARVLAVMTAATAQQSVSLRGLA